MIALSDIAGRSEEKIKGVVAMSEYARELRERLEAYRWLHDRLIPLLIQLYSIALEAHLRFPKIYKNPNTPPSYSPVTVDDMLLDLIDKSWKLIEELTREEARAMENLEEIEKQQRGGKSE